MTHIPDAAIHAALLSMAQDNIGADVQGLLMHGFDKLNAKPNALRNALAAALPHLSAPCAVEVESRAKRVASIHRKKDDGTVFGSFYKETAEVIEELLSCVVTKPVDVAAVREHALDEVKSLCAEYGNDSQPDSEYRLACNDLIEAIRALSAEPAQGDQWHPIETAPNSEMLLLACADWPLVKCGREVPVKVGHKSFGSWTVFGASWTPTHWMPLPAAPTAEAWA